MLTAEHRQIALLIHQRVTKLRAQGLGKEMLPQMIDYVERYKYIMKALTPEEAGLLCLEFDGFYYFAILLDESIMKIAQGDIPMPSVH